MREDFQKTLITKARSLEPHKVERQGTLTVLVGGDVGAVFVLDRATTLLGRDADATVSVDDDGVSRRHAQIVLHNGGYELEDLGSTNGTFVDGERVEGLRTLEDGCRIHLGTRTVLHFRLHDAVEMDAAREAYALTVRDALTGLFNRRHLQERLWSEAAFARRHHTPLSLILLDIDHFKRINDEHGHAVGDAALILLAEALSALTRQEDILARYGGEEFALIARGIDREKTLALAERMRCEIEQQRLAIARGCISFTVSVGIAHSETGAEIQAQQLFEAADRALYAAKDAGRNVVSIAPSAADELS